MIRFLRNHYEAVLMAVSLVFLIIIAAAFVFGGRVLFLSVTKALLFQAVPGETLRFDIERAKELGLQVNS